jgi:signal transduction histidine kinase
MATRYGGRLELEGATESILLPADGDQREVADLRRELEAAQRQGEAYARELAAVFSYSQSPPPRFPSQAPETPRPLGALCAMAAGMAAELRSIFSAIERESAVLRESKRPVSDALVQQTALGSQMVADLVGLAQCPVHESVQHVNLADAVRSAMGELESRATQRGVTLKSRIPAHVDLDSKPVTVTLLARTLIHDAIQAAPRGGHVTVTLEPAPKGSPTLIVTDDGPPIPDDSFAALLSTRLDPTTAGRPSTIALFWAQTLAQHLGTQLELGRRDAAARPPNEEPQPGVTIEVKFP